MAEIPPTNTNHTDRAADGTNSGSQEKPISGAASNSISPNSGEFYPAVIELRDWCIQNPIGAALVAAILGTLTFFFEFAHPFSSGTQSTLVWARAAYNGEQSYGAIAPFASLAMIIYHWGKLRRTPKAGSNLGWVWLVAGIVIYVLAGRCLQPRLALVSIPFLIYGSVMAVWGKATARIILFPCAFLIFMVPAIALEQTTFRLQFVVTWLVGIASHFVGVGIQAVGTTLTASDGSFHFEIAEGCSGIRSLIAMIMITAAFVHLTQDRLWKKIVIFLASVVFALIGNMGRIFSIILVAKYYDPKFAGGRWHDWSDWMFFPVAIAAMLALEWLVNLNYADWLARHLKPVEGTPHSPEVGISTSGDAAGETKPSEPGDNDKKLTQYDY